MPPNETLDWIETEKAARQFHARSSGDSIQLWVDGFNLVHSNLSRVGGRKLPEEQGFMVGLIAASIDSMRCVFNLAMTGYFMQAMNLARLLAEISTTYWYLKVFPEEHESFDNPNPREPEMKDMLTKIESCADKSQYPLEDIIAIRDFVKSHELHKYSHVSYLTVPATVEESSCGTASMTFGPRVNAELCHGVFSDTLSLVFRIVACTFDIMNVLGLDTTDDALAYADRISSYFSETSEGCSPNDGTVGTN